MSKRRDLLKAVTLAGAAGAIWKKPVVDSVVLPAHAGFSIFVDCELGPRYAVCRPGPGCEECNRRNRDIFRAHERECIRPPKEPKLTLCEEP